MVLAPDPLEGTPYAAIAELGKGGMGVVYEAEHRKLGTRVAVKLLDGFGPDARTLDRMRLEAQALAQLSSPHLVGVSHLDETPRGRPYFVMELLRGTSLDQEVKTRGALPASEAVSIVEDVLAGLEVAHAAGLLHRDIKLANLFYCRPDRSGRRFVKILDFGIAKTTEASGLKPLVLPTEPGLLIGTPRYAAPEQARGERLDERADLYALGCVFYALLAGRGPFDHHGSSATLLVAHVSEEPVPPSRHAPHRVPPALDALVLRLLAKRPADRFANVAEVRAALSMIDASRSEPMDLPTTPLERLPPTERLVDAPREAEEPPRSDRSDTDLPAAEPAEDATRLASKQKAPAPLRIDKATAVGIAVVALLVGTLAAALAMRLMSP